MKSPKNCDQQNHVEMSGDAVVQLMQLFDQNSIDVVVDGGWGVDALLGEQTRPHRDLDIALQHTDKRHFWYIHLDVCTENKVHFCIATL